MTKLSFIKILTGAALCIGLATAPMTVYAATPEEAAEYARELGWPEEFVQQALNMYKENPEKYPPEVIDIQMQNLRDYKDIIVTNIPHDPNAIVPALTTAVQPEPNEPVIDSGTITLTMPDGSTFDRISREQFISLSYEEKQIYISSFTSEQQTVFINNLSPEEYQSMLGQLPADKKGEIINNMTEITNQLGLTMNVEEISDDNIIFAMKNKNGELISINSVKNTVDSTGYDRRGIFAGASALVLSGIAGAFFMVKKCFRKE